MAFLVGEAAIVKDRRGSVQIFRVLQYMVIYVLSA